LVLSFTALLFGVTGAFGQSTDQLIVAATQEQRSDCRIPPEIIGGLVDQLNRVEDKQDRSKILSFLSGLPEWRSSDHPKALRTLTRISREDIFSATLVARAVERADGELIDILVEASEFEDAIAKLRGLAANNEGRNSVYLGFIKIALAEALQEDAFAAINDQSLPLDERPENEEIKTRLLEAASIFEDASALFVKLRNEEDFGLRDFSLDLPYLASLVRFVAGEEDWSKGLQGIIASESLRDAYDSRTDSRHILVDRPLKPSILTSLVISSDGCSQRRTVLDHTNEKFGRQKVRKFFNPIQLANYTCNALVEKVPLQHLAQLVSILDRFENRDYRVVVGHFRGDEVKFSFYSKDELLEITNKAAASISGLMESSNASSTETDATSQFRSSCSINSGIQPTGLDVVGIQATGRETGYIYIGEGLSFTEAERLQRQLSEDRDFRDSYLIRPTID